MKSHTHAHAHTPTPTHARTHTRTHAHTHTHTHTLVYVEHTSTHACILTPLMNSYTHTHACTPTHTCTPCHPRMPTTPPTHHVSCPGTPAPPPAGPSPCGSAEPERERWLGGRGAPSAPYGGGTGLTPPPPETYNEKVSGAETPHITGRHRQTHLVSKERWRLRLTTARPHHTRTKSHLLPLPSVLQTCYTAHTTPTHHIPHTSHPHTTHFSHITPPTHHIPHTSHFSHATLYTTTPLTQTHNHSPTQTVCHGNRASTVRNESEGRSCHEQDYRLHASARQGPHQRAVCLPCTGGS